ncbi:MAG: porin [Alphaproteobacteria bacterium]|nr:porin [Alphaproteobacteria bacterium]
MKKVLLSTAAIAGLAMVASPAQAQVKLDLGGFFKGYGAYVSQDDTDGAATDANKVGVVRHTEVHFGGETTLDNGLTVGAHIETEADGGNGFEVEESYVYFSGGWGRVNFGAEDGAQYLLQVSAPAADDNIDGIRQFVQPVNYAVLVDTSAGNTLFATAAANGFDYETNATGYSDKLTYLSPIMNGFQLGLSWTPDVSSTSGSPLTVQTAYAPDFTGVLTDDQVNTFGAAFEGGLRYEGQFNNVGVIAGAGYTHMDLESKRAAGAFAVGDAQDDRTVWNVGLDLDIGPFGIGASYSEDDYGDTVASVTGGNPTGTKGDEETLVVGVDYTTGPFKLGASYMNQDGTQNITGLLGNDGVETDRYTGGVVYTYGPGMTFRGSVSYIEHDNVAGLPSGDNVDATSVLIGTQINF